MTLSYNYNDMDLREKGSQNLYTGSSAYISLGKNFTKMN